MSVFVYTCRYTRDRSISELRRSLDFYKNNIFRSFDDPDKQTEDYLSENRGKFQHLEDGSERLYEEACDFHQDLHFLKNDMLASALTSLLHLLERQVRRHLWKELGRSLPQNSKLYEVVTRDPLKDWCNFFSGSTDWQVVEAPFYENLLKSICIVNAYKHGAGPALNGLRKRYPEYIKAGSFRDTNPFSDNKTFERLEFPNVDAVWIEEGQFDELVLGIIGFWENIPEYISLAEQR